MRKFMLGPVSDLPLADARAKGREMSVLVQKGTDPQAEKSRERASETVTEVAELFIAYSKENNRPKTSAEVGLDMHALMAIDIYNLKGYYTH